jgi:hypothetical protein
MEADKKYRGKKISTTRTLLLTTVKKVFGLLKWADLGNGMKG